MDNYVAFDTGIWYDFGMKIEIELQKTDKTLAELLTFMGGEKCEGIITKEIVSFKVENPVTDWFSDKTKKEFEAKINKEAVKNNLNYKVLSVKKINENI